MVIASNAVFEFLSNQEVIDLCAASCDPLQASEAVTRAAYKKWIEKKNRCDDITVIVCFLSKNATKNSARSEVVNVSTEMDVPAMADFDEEDDV